MAEKRPETPVASTSVAALLRMKAANEVPVEPSSAATFEDRTEWRSQEWKVRVDRIRDRIQRRKVDAKNRVYRPRRYEEVDAYTEPKVDELSLKMFVKCKIE